ncbi:IucA/IucC family siderophore biosynthesis protein [Streptomyces sp. NBC_01275]|uniref:IucA/IucC family protein n=1 Tax=Streptomyces sp. NBC_01275 TaxID=2903807 RepID=UPI00224EB345|nr:IucA/IucC family siderophore biosynthesis protein [Streptomyces sp. NBC_01275]MCX4765905.1 IucA/IucC family siderophore biosynthesis protein [Streptomyces sp. NBC_01275]
MHRPPTAEAEVAAELAALRPALVPRWTAELPGARAAVLTRLWRALAHEPLPWIERSERSRAGGQDGDRAGNREGSREGLLLRLADGRRLHGPHADPYATSDYVTEVRLDGVAYTEPARLMTELAVPHGADFAVELDHSTASLALSRAGQEAQSALPDPGPPTGAWPRTDWEWEQRVVDGHPYHPNCRSRPGFSVAEQLAYGPEHRPSVRLALLAVPAEECLVSGEWPDALRDGGRLAIPVHPWQAAHVLKRSGELDHSGEEVLTAHPLMSLRTLALPDGPHVKTALSTRLTSSVRDISVASIVASAALSSFAESLATRTDGLLHMTRTLGAATADSPDLAAVLRESPRVYGAPGEHVVPVAALAGTELARSPAWLAEFARLTLTVGLRLLELGVALEAHGQNLLVVLSASGAPLRLVYRDLADIRVSPARLARHGVPLPPDLPDRILTDDVTALRRKLFGSLVAGALAGTAGSREALRAALEAAVRELPRTPDLVALCESPLPVKALTLMRLSPGVAGDQWAGLPNPLTEG